MKTVLEQQIDTDTHTQTDAADTRTMADTSKSDWIRHKDTMVDTKTHHVTPIVAQRHEQIRLSEDSSKATQRHRET